MCGKIKFTKDGRDKTGGEVLIYLPLYINASLITDWNSNTLRIKTWFYSSLKCYFALAIFQTYIKYTMLHISKVFFTFFLLQKMVLL